MAHGLKMAQGLPLGKLNRKALLATIIILLVLLGTYLFLNRGRQSTLYTYYPEATTVFLEFEPGEKLLQRFLVLVNSANHPEHKDKAFRKNLITKFNTTFEPRFSMGVWPDSPPKEAAPGKAQTPVPTLNNNVLVVFPLQNDQQTIKEIIQQFGGNAENFQQAEFQGISYYIDPQTESSFSVMNQNFLLTNSSRAMETIIQQKQGKESTVYDHPVNRKYLSLLPRRRDGTFVINASAYATGYHHRVQEEIDRQVGESALGGSVTRRLNRLSDVLPVTVGALRVKKGTLLHVQAYTPLLIENIGKPELKTELKELLHTTSQFQSGSLLPADTTFLLGFAGLDELFDLYRITLATPEEKSMFQGADGFLRMFNLELRKDVVGLLNGQTILASRSEASSPVILLKKSDAKQDTLDQLLAILTKSGLPVEQKEERLGKTTVTTLKTQRGEQETTISLGTLGSMIGIAPIEEFSNLVKVQERDTENLASKKLYRDMLDGLPKTAACLLYADLSEISKTKERLARYQWLEAISGTLTSKTASPSEEVINSHLVIKIKPAG